MRYSLASAAGASDPAWFVRRFVHDLGGVARRDASLPDTCCARGPEALLDELRAFEAGKEAAGLAAKAADDASAIACVSPDHLSAGGAGPVSTPSREEMR